MNYYIQRQLPEYGPYTLADLQRYVAQGNILLTDLTRNEGTTEWVPVSQVIGNIPAAPPVPAALPAGGTVYAGNAAPAGTAHPVAAVQPLPGGPMPPDLHWGLVLLIGFLCGIFQWVWLFIEVGFVKKISPASNFLAFLIAGIAIQIGSLILYFIAILVFAAAAGNSNNPPVGPLLVVVFLFFGALLVGAVLFIVGIFKMRDAIQEYYNTVEPINLRLSGVMTFFFNVFYFQYHFSRIAVWKRTGYLEPQQLS
jgi:hypothetical protein